jgi:hypothetical protein
VTQRPSTSRRRAWLQRWGVAALGLVVALVVLSRAHLHFLVPYPTPVSNDEGYISAMVLRMLAGRWLPYVDGISQRGPVLYWLAAVAMKLGGRFTWVPLRVLSWALGLSTVGLSFALGAELFAPLAGAFAALLVAYFLGYELNPWDGLGYNGEVVAMQFALGAMLLVARAMRPLADGAEGDDTRRRGRALVVAGALAALAGLSKQMTLIHAVPCALWIALGRVGDPRTARERTRDLVRFVAGAAVPYALVLGLYAATGHLREFVYYYQRYGRDIFMAPVTAEVYRDKVREQIDKYYLGIAAVAMVSLAALGRWLGRVFAQPTGRWERVRHEAPAAMALAQFVAGLVGACFTGRFFPHYFVQVFPLAGVLLGGVAAEYLGAAVTQEGAAEAEGEGAAVSGAPGWWRAQLPALCAVLGATGLLTVSASALARNVALRRVSDRWYKDPRQDPIVRYVVEKSGPRDTVFVWGFRAEVHVSAGRMPASRYVYSVYPSGVVPWFPSTREQEDARQVPGAREQLLADLEATQPELVVDAGRSMNSRYMYNYPALRNYLDQHYCFLRYVDGEPVYRRRRGPTCPPADY